EAHPCPTAKRDLDDALAIRPPRPTDAPGACVSATSWRFNASEYCRRFVSPGCCLVSTKPVVDTCSA
ncbi:MAG TPA: hypothetical protein VJ349_21025, partial [Stellaceae bacterium]|nr:hypothetical protein [Stellaceae bacterium]